jgi:peptide/nickel transport system ATP-binding protein
VTRGADPSPPLEVRELSVTLFDRLGREIRPVRDVSFSVEPGETVGIVGESGSGKSTLALALTGLHARLVGARFDGQVSFQGRDLLSLPPRELRRLRGSQVGYIFQSPEAALDPPRTVGKQIADVIRSHRPDVSRREALGQAVELLRRVGIRSPETAISRYAHEFSGGQKQRAVIAIAISNRPKLLIADEPTSSLDVLVQQTVLDLIKELQQEEGMALVFISHDLRLVSRMTERTLVMYAGRIVEAGPTASVLTSPRHWYTVGLLRSLPDPHRTYGPSDRFDVIEGKPPSAAVDPAGCPFLERCPHAEAVCAEQAPPFVPFDGSDRHGALCWFPASERLPRDSAKT